MTFLFGMSEIKSKTLAFCNLVMIYIMTWNITHVFVSLPDVVPSVSDCLRYCAAWCDTRENRQDEDEESATGSVADLNAFDRGDGTCEDPYDSDCSDSEYEEVVGLVYYEHILKYKPCIGRYIGDSFPYTERCLANRFETLTEKIVKIWMEL